MFQYNTILASRRSFRSIRSSRSIRSMFAKNLKPDRHAARFALAIIGALSLTGCQAVVSTAPEAQVRVVDASPDAPGLDIYQGSTALAYNLGFGTVTSYVPLPPDVYTISATSAGTKQTLSSSKATLVASAQYTVLIGNSAASLMQVILKDQS